jgi:mannose/fructose/N-acetylgalactosamine-specific phosphotransferase system component IID
MAELKKTSDAARNKAFLRWAYGNLTCFSQEHMQTFGYLCRHAAHRRRALRHR